MSLDAIGLVCENIKETIKFYGLFGMEFKDSGEGNHFEGATPSGLRLMLDSEALIKQLIPDWQRSNNSNIILAFKMDTVEKVNTIHEQVVQSGFASVKEPYDAFWGQRYASVKDPDGNQIDIFCDM